MVCTETYKEHIMYTFNAFCKVVIRYAAINAWRERNRRQKKWRKKLAYLVEPYEEYPVTICNHTVIFTNGELATALQSLPEKKREIIFLYFFGHYTQQEIGELYGRCRSTIWYHIHSALQILQKEMEVFSNGET